MYILIILIIIFLLARTTLRGLFNRIWREKTQDIVWSFGNEKNFWQLMNEKIDAPKLFFAYLRTRNQRDYIRVYDCVMDIESPSVYEISKNALDLKSIPKIDSIRLISTLNQKIEGKEKVITDFLTENKVSFTDDEIRKSFKELEEDPWSISGDVTKHYNRFMPAHLDSLIKSDKTGVGIWKVLKDFVDKEHDFEFDRSGNKHVDFLESLKMLQDNVNNFVIDLICGKFENKDKSEKLKNELKEWQQLHMLRWCVVDYSSMRNLSILNEKIWRLIISIFL
jgi:hypothetical protein